MLSDKICEEAAALKDNCVRPETKERYFKSFTLGKGNTQNVFKGSEVSIKDAMHEKLANQNS